MIRNKSQALRMALILIASTALVVVVTWFVPSLSAASLNMLFRLRGMITPPTDIIILAIDDQSLQRLGQWPWPRSVMAGVLDKLTLARARSIGLDVIYAEPTVAGEDLRLAASIARNGRVVLPAQLYESAAKENSASLTTNWLRPLPEFANAAKAVGHAHISPEVDGMVRSIQLSKADDQANKFWAFSLEVLRAAEQIPADNVKEESGLLRFGAYQIPVRDESAPAIPGVTIVRPNEMMINFAGPTGSFRYYSLADLIDGKISPTALADKIVLVGAVAESMGDTRVVPFMHYSAEHSQGGQEMPGVEIHANIINTIRSRLSFRPLPEGIAFAAAVVVILLSAMAVRWLDGWRQVLILSLILFSILAGSFFAFSRYLIIPPLAPMLTGFLAVVPLLLNRSLAASRELDIKLAALVTSQKGFLPEEPLSGTEFINNQLKLALPQSLAWKLRTVDDLTTRLLARMSFINRILTSMGEGVLVADLAGRIVFANHEAWQLFGGSEAELIGANFADLLIERGALDSLKLREVLEEVSRGQNAQLEFEIAATEPRFYSLLLSALPATRDALATTNENLTLHPLPTTETIGVVVLISDITKRVELDRMKTETLQLVSHELRTPLTSIQGLSDVLLKFPVAAAESREMISTIYAEAVRLRETINRYLDLTRLESGAQPLHLSLISCQQLIEGCLRNLSVFAAERNIRLNSQIKSDVGDLWADPQLLSQAINNLLSNAIKYSPPNTEVTVTAERNHANILISVRDQGYGIPPEARERIFEKFYRLERDTTSGVVGTGLGLPLVKEIVEQHGGRITFESLQGSDRNSGRLTGSIFTIHLPLQPQSNSATAS